MRGLPELVRVVATELDRSPGWALVGGLAVSARTEPRFTRDVDLVVSVPGDGEAETIVRRLLGHGFRIVEALEQTDAKRLATVRLTDAAGSNAEADSVVDLLFASSGIEAEIVEWADRLDLVPGLVVPIAAIGHLIAMKLLSRDDVARPQDLVDLRTLVRAADDEQRRLARDGVGLIEARGFARGRDLRRALAEVLTESDERIVDGP